MNKLERESERRKERAHIISELIGHYTGAGEANCDRKSLENLKFLDDYVLPTIFVNLAYNALYDGCKESAIKIKEKSTKILKYYAKYIYDVLQIEPKGTKNSVENNIGEENESD